MTSSEDDQLVLTPLVHSVRVPLANGGTVRLIHGYEVPADADSVQVARLRAEGKIGQIRRGALRAPWPPPVLDTDAYDEVLVMDGRTGRTERVRARLVPLWGQTVAVAGDGEVYCRRCLAFVPFEVLTPTMSDHTVDYRPERRLT